MGGVGRGRGSRQGGEQGFCGVKIPSSIPQASSLFAPGVRLERLRPQLRKVKEFPYTGWLGGVNYTKKEFVAKYKNCM